MLMHDVCCQGFDDGLSLRGARSVVALLVDGFSCCAVIQDRSDRGSVVEYRAAVWAKSVSMKPELVISILLSLFGRGLASRHAKNDGG